MWANGSVFPRPTLGTVIDSTIGMRVLTWLRQDVRDAIRSLQRTRTVTFAAVATLALGIGATTAIFSLVEAVLLRRLPVAAPNRLFFITHGAGDILSSASHYPWFEQVKQIDAMFDGVAAYNIRDFKVASAGGVERVVGQYASGNYHAVIGAPLQLGRGFSDEDDRVLAPIAVISDSYWSRRFGRDRDVIGKTLEIAGRPLTIVGVTAAGFDGLRPGRSIDITLPISVLIQDDPGFLTRTDTWTSMPLVARLKLGVDVVAARSVVAATYRSYMSLPGNQEFSRTSGGQLRAATLEPAAHGSDQLRRTYVTPLRALMGMVVVVLLITCANVANLLLMRAPARAREVAIRMSLGATRARVACQLLTESVLLAAGGGALGLLLAAWGTEFVSWLFRTGLNPIVIDLQPNSRVLLFAIAISLLTGLVFGIAPAWRTTGLDLSLAIKRGEAAWRAGRRRFGHEALVGAQIAMCFVLMFGAGLFGRTLQNLLNVESGFRKDSVVVFALDVLDSSFDRERLAPLCADVINRIMARPDVRSGSCSSMSPVATNSEGRTVTVPGSGRDARRTPIVSANSIDAGYFQTLGIEVVRGRPITDQDTATSTRVAVLSESMARYFFGDTDPLGRTFSFGSREIGPPITIVGVVRDVRQELREAAPFMAYTPLVQRDEPTRALVAAIRTSGPTAGVASAVRNEVRAITRDLPVTYVRTMEEQFGASLVGERLLTSLSGAFALLALGLACIGLYGVMSYDVARRVRDIGIRLALGASQSQILSQVLRRSLLVTIAGIALGAATAILLSRSLSSFLFGLEPHDPGTLILSTVVLGVTSLIAGYLPARGASRVDPCVTLRME
jgi:predicted permease